jgi:hypothetical protein
MSGFGHLHQNRHPLLNLVVGGNTGSKGFGDFGVFHRILADVFNLSDTIA